MAYNSYGGGTRKVDMYRTEADLAINIRKATSIGMLQHPDAPAWKQNIQELTLL